MSAMDSMIDTLINHDRDGRAVSERITNVDAVDDAAGRPPEHHEPASRRRSRSSRPASGSRSRPTTRSAPSQALALPRRPRRERAVPDERQRRHGVAEHHRHGARRHRRARPARPRPRRSGREQLDRPAAATPDIAAEIDQIIESIKTDGQHAVRRPVHLRRHEDDDRPVHRGGVDTYVGRHRRRSTRQIGPGVQVPVNVDGSSVIGDGSTPAA